MQKLFIHYAAETGDMAALAEAFKHHEPLDIPDAQGRRPIHLAVFRGQIEIINELHKSGANLNQQDATALANTPLHTAVQTRNMPAFKFLLNLGANPEVKNAHGQTLEQYAQVNNWQPAIEFLQGASTAKPQETQPGQAPSFDDIEEELNATSSTDSSPKKVDLEKLKTDLATYLHHLAKQIRPLSLQVLEIINRMQIFDAVHICNEGYSLFQIPNKNNNEAVLSLTDLCKNLFLTSSVIHCCCSTFSQLDYERAKNGDKNLEFARLAGADLSNIDLSGADLFGACLQGAKLQHTNLNQANLIFTDLSKTIITDCTFKETKFYEVKLEESHWQNVTLNKIQLYSINCSGSLMKDIKIKKSKINLFLGSNLHLEDCVFENNVIIGWSTNNCTASNLRFFNNTLQGLWFNRSNLNNLSFVKNLLYNFKSKHAQLAHITFDGSYLLDARFNHSHINDLRIIQPPAITWTAFSQTFPEQPRPGQQQQQPSPFENLKVLHIGTMSFKNATLDKCIFVGSSADSVRGQNIATPSNLTNTAIAFFYNYLPSLFSTIIPNFAKSSPERELAADSIYSLPICLLTVDFHLADLSTVYLKNIFIAGTENAFTLAGNQGCILQDCFPPNADALRAAGLMVNGKINPEFVGLYGSAQLQENFSGLVTREYILAAVRAVANATCSIT